MTHRFLFFAFVCLATAAACGESPSDGDPVATAEDAIQGQFCGGIAGLPCPEGLVCVDDPRDSCDPNNGGADCGGVCRRARRPRCNYGDPTKQYISRDPAQCAVIRFVCADGYQPFFDACGCGCELVSGGTCGGNVCGAREFCCNPSCGICAPVGGACIQQFCSSTSL